MESLRPVRVHCGTCPRGGSSRCSSGSGQIPIRCGTHSNTQTRLPARRRTSSQSLRTAVRNGSGAYRSCNVPGGACRGCRRPIIAFPEVVLLPVAAHFTEEFHRISVGKETFVTDGCVQRRGKQEPRIQGQFAVLCGSSERKRRTTENQQVFFHGCVG